MKYTPKLLNKNVNVSTTHPLVELFWLVGGLVLICGIVFIGLGLATDLAVSKTPVTVENWFGKSAISQFPATKNQALQHRLDGLIRSLPPHSPLHEYTFTAYLSDDDSINAVALPGGNIVVFKGLLKRIKSENELAMVLSHELGHFAARDHLRGLGRGLGLAVGFALLFGQDSAASEIISKSLLSFQIKYSKDQETAADKFGLELLTSHYGHAGGAADFFTRMASRAGSRFPYLLASHPHPDARIKMIKERIVENDYRIEQTLPLSADLHLKH